MDHAREDREVYSNSVSKYFFNPNFVHVNHYSVKFTLIFVFSIAQQIYSSWVFCSKWLYVFSPKFLEINTAQSYMVLTLNV